MDNDQQEWLPEIQQARRAFNRAAASYDQYAVLQQEVQSRTLEKLDPMLLQAANDLGCRPARAFWTI